MNEIDTSASCAAIRQCFPDYVDGAVSGRVMAAVAEHLEGCSGCSTDFAMWRAVDGALAVASSPVQAPADLPARLRETIADEAGRRARWMPANVLERWGEVLRLVLLRASAGLVTTLLMLGTLGWLVSEVAAPAPVLANDQPLGALTAPHFRYSVAPPQPVVTSQDTAIVIQARIDCEGRVYDYRILSGPDDPATQAQVRDQLILLVYQPASAFGEPVRGQVLISFLGVSVKG